MAEKLMVGNRNQPLFERSSVDTIMQSEVDRMGKFDRLFAEKVKLVLTKEEALVLFEMVSEITDQPVIPIRDASERQAIWNLTCSFESALAEPFDKDYNDIVQEAKRRLATEDN